MLRTGIYEFIDLSEGVTKILNLDMQTKDLIKYWGRTNNRGHVAYMVADRVALTS